MRQNEEEKGEKHDADIGKGARNGLQPRQETRPQLTIPQRREEMCGDGLLIDGQEGEQRGNQVEQARRVADEIGKC